MNHSDLVLSFLYLAKERYQFTPKEAAKDLFKRYKGRINELVYIDAIKTVLKDDVIEVFEQNRDFIFEAAEKKISPCGY